MTRFLWTLTLLLTVTSCLDAAPKPPAAPLPVERFLRAPGMEGSVAGVMVVDARTGETLYEHNPDTRLLPASNAKLFTASAALELLGEDFTWTTKVLSVQKPDAAGVVDGFVYLIGSGDASLVTANMDDLAVQMKKAGITQILHGIYGDGKLFPGEPYGFGWEWDDFSDEEFPQINALTVNDGDVTITVTGSNAPDKECTVAYDPLPVLLGGSAKTTAGSIPTVTAHRRYGVDFVDLSGLVPVGQSVTLRVPVDMPDAYTVQVLKSALTAHGVAVLERSPMLAGYRQYDDAGGFSGTRLPPPTNILASHTSAPLSAYVTHMLKESDNLYAECLVRTVGVQKGTGGSFASGYAAEIPALQKIGVDMTNVTLVDGCGVGRRNFVTARAICQLLVGIKKSPHGNTFYNALPIAGVDGTLKSRMAGTPAQGNCHAKTGTLGAVRALSGYVTGKNGTPYAFSILLNNFPGTARQAGAVQDGIVEWLAAH